MSGASIAAEVANALREVAGDVGTGEFVVTLVKGQANPQTPWDGGYYGEPDLVLYAAMEISIDDSEIDGTLIAATDRMLWLEAKDKPKPLTADKIILDNKSHSIERVKIKQNAGVPYYYVVQARV